MNILVFSFLLAFIMVLASLLLWLFFDHGVDKLKFPEEWKDAGSSGERTIYRALVDDIHVPENQILRNVYIPNSKGKTSEIDLLVVSKKGIFVFEVKNYGGKIYGDMKRQKWVQYLGGKKNYFYNPFRQNKTHCDNLKKYISRYGEIPIVSLLTTIARGEWKVRNLSSSDFFLGYNCHFKDIYNSMPVCEQMSKSFEPIIKMLTPLSRPGDDIKEKHIAEHKQN